MASHPVIKNVLLALIILFGVMIVGSWLLWWFIKISILAMIFMSVGFVVCMIVLWLRWRHY